MYFNQIEQRQHVVMIRDDKTWVLDDVGDERVFIEAHETMHPHRSFPVSYAESLLEDAKLGYTDNHQVKEGDLYKLVPAYTPWVIIKMDDKWYSPHPENQGMHEVEIHFSHANEGYSFPDLVSETLKLKVSHCNVHGRCEFTIKGKKIINVHQWMGDHDFDSETAQLDVTNAVSRFFFITDRKWEK